MSDEKRAQRKIQRKYEAEKFRKDRLICDYIRVRHPDIYSEAENVYNYLREKYPEKKDLRKLNEFESISKQDMDIPIKKYYIRKTKHYVPKERSVPKDNMHLTEPMLPKYDMLLTDPKDDMVLTIPLMSTNDLEEVLLGQLSQNKTTVVMEQSTQTWQNETAVVMEQSTQPSKNETAVVTEPLEPPLTDAMMADLINDLKEDPDICTFFENIEFELDDCPLW